MFNGIIEKKFIVFEGIDGAGKSSLVHSLSQALLSKGNKIFSTAEPSTGFAGTLIRDILSKNDSKIPIHSTFFPYLYAADRYEHVYGNKGIYAHIKNNALVLCDRYFFSSYVYQGLSKELLDLSIMLNKDFPLPSILFFLDITPEESMKRLKHRESNTNKKLHATVENTTTLEKVSQRYHAIIEKVSQQSKVQCYYLDANQSLEMLTQQCISYITQVLDIL